MIFQPQVSFEAERATKGFLPKPNEVAESARRYQGARELEAKHLALMAQHNLQADWTAEIRDIVLTAREHIRAARVARRTFRHHLRTFVSELRTERQSLPAVLRQTRALVLSLQSAGAITDDGGWLEAEILEWAIEDYEAAAA